VLENKQNEGVLTETILMVVSSLLDRFWASQAV